MAEVNATEILKSFNELVAEKGKAFQIIFYLFFGIYVISLFAGIISGLLELSISVLFPLAGVLLIAYFVKEKYLYILLILSLLYPSYLFCGILLSSIALTYMLLGNTIFCYPLVGLVSLCFGLLFAFLFNKASNTSLKLISSSVIFSSIGSTVFIFLKITSMLANFLGKSFGGIPMGNASGGYENLLSMGQGLSPELLFAIFLILFNLPFIRYFLTREDKKYKYLLLCLIPIFVFVSLSFLLYTFSAPMLQMGLPI
ncbi:MAG: hypothetical protein KAU95_02115 [Candidatus Aenigmarchaeota archaeon]|nr:hypothetical protein [Candidatus Aenigmarchaeota archaeon]